MIHAARKSRQKAREMGDFIPMDDSKRYTAAVLIPSYFIRTYDCVAATTVEILVWLERMKKITMLATTKTVKWPEGRQKELISPLTRRQGTRKGDEKHFLLLRNKVCGVVLN